MKQSDLRVWGDSALLEWAEKQIASGILSAEEEVMGRQLVVDVRKAYGWPLPCHRAANIDTPDNFKKV